MFVLSIRRKGKEDPEQGTTAPLIWSTLWGGRGADHRLGASSWTTHLTSFTPGPLFPEVVVSAASMFLDS